MTFREKVELILLDAMNEAIEISELDEDAGKVIHAPKAVDLILQAAREELVPKEKIDEDGWHNAKRAETIREIKKRIDA